MAKKAAGKKSNSGRGLRKVRGARNDKKRELNLALKKALAGKAAPRVAQRKGKAQPGKKAAAKKQSKQHVKKAPHWAKQKLMTGAKKKKAKKAKTGAKIASGLSPVSVLSDPEALLPTPSPAGSSQNAMDMFGTHSSAFKDLGKKAYKKLARELHELEQSCQELKSDCAVLCAELAAAEAEADQKDLVDLDLRISEADLMLPKFPEKNLKNMGVYLDKAFRASMKKLKTNTQKG